VVVGPKVYLHESKINAVSITIVRCSSGVMIMILKSSNK
jgi:hypothetical protein